MFVNQLAVAPVPADRADRVEHHVERIASDFADRDLAAPQGRTRPAALQRLDSRRSRAATATARSSANSCNWRPIEGPCARPEQALAFGLRSCKYSSRNCLSGPDDCATAMMDGDRGTPGPGMERGTRMVFIQQEAGARRARIGGYRSGYALAGCQTGGTDGGGSGDGAILVGTTGQGRHPRPGRLCTTTARSRFRTRCSRS